MNWKEFKDYIESEGVTNDTYIGRILLMEDRISECSPKVRILNVGTSEIVVID